MPRPTRLAALLLALVAIISAALPLPVVVPLLLAGGVAGCVLIDLLVARRRVPSLERTALPTLSLLVPVPFRAKVGELAQARAVRIRQPAPPGLCVDPPSAESEELSGELTGRVRGTHVLPPVTVRASGPLGLGSLDYTLGASEDVSVFPDLPRARRLAAARRRGRATDEGRIRARLGLGTEFETIREYSPDDDIRQVNWVATARVGRPMSNQYRVEENRDLMCVVDAGRLMASPAGLLTRLDVALNAVAVLAVAAEEAGDRVGALAFDAKVTRQLSPRRRGAEAVVRALFDLETTEVESDYERAFQAVGRQKRALVVVFTDLVDEGAARTLIGAVPVLVRRHAVLVASGVDADLTTAVSRAPDDLRDVMRASVAVDLLASRQRAINLLEALGAVVVEAPPQALGPACVEAYLRLKQRARL
ncbi:MAG TPA: DUF58 domain-containing protein [Acidimicrobiales bacterium]|nr:DUF58 domain-containing protein [Acidimicrobiales bacterium]